MMDADSLERWRHDHVFLGAQHGTHERRTWAVVALMRCHAAVGERAQALRIYARYADQLRKELDAEPGDEALDMAEALQRGTTTER